MKARVIATGDIVEISEDCSYVYAEHFDKSYNINELEFLNVKENSFPKDEDYWTRLEHQYAGMAMQSYVSNNVYLREIREMCKEPQEMRDLIADLSILLATTLVQKLKEKEK